MNIFLMRKFRHLLFYRSSSAVLLRDRNLSPPADPYTSVLTVLNIFPLKYVQEIR